MNGVKRCENRDNNICPKEPTLNWGEAVVYCSQSKILQPAPISVIGPKTYRCLIRERMTRDNVFLQLFLNLNCFLFEGITIVNEIWSFYRLRSFCKSLLSDYSNGSRNIILDLGVQQIIENKKVLDEKSKILIGINHAETDSNLNLDTYIGNSVKVNLCRASIENYSLVPFFITYVILF